MIFHFSRALSRDAHSISIDRHLLWRITANITILDNNIFLSNISRIAAMKLFWDFPFFLCAALHRGKIIPFYHVTIFKLFSCTLARSEWIGSHAFILCNETFFFTAFFMLKLRNRVRNKLLGNYFSFSRCRRI